MPGNNRYTFHRQLYRQIADIMQVLSYCAEARPI
jgi:hypothetical protein